MSRQIRKLFPHLWLSLELFEKYKKQLCQNFALHDGHMCTNFVLKVIEEILEANGKLCITEATLRHEWKILPCFLYAQQKSDKVVELIESLIECQRQAFKEIRQVCTSDNTLRKKCYFLDILEAVVTLLHYMWERGRDTELPVASTGQQIF